MKSAIKVVVKELIPILVSRPSDFDSTQGERVSDLDGELVSSTFYGCI